mgnify:CR=1 FL=1
MSDERRRLGREDEATIARLPSLARDVCIARGQLAYEERRLESALAQGTSVVDPSVARRIEENVLELKNQAKTLQILLDELRRA